MATSPPGSPHDTVRDLTEEVPMRTNERDLDAIAAGLANWLPARLGADGPVTVTDAHLPTNNGLSSVTLLFTAAWRHDGEDHERRFVGKLTPEAESFPVFPNYNLRMQHDVMAAVGAASEVPIPPLVGIEESDDAIGSPFLLMEHVDGRIPEDNPPYVFTGWLYDAAPAERRGVQDATIELLAKIHAIPWSRFPRLAPSGPDPLRAHVDKTRAYYEWTRRTDGLRIPVLDNAFEWLEANWPSQPGAPVLSWGDSRPGNVIYDGTTPKAVLDWEMAALGPREIDLAWLIFIHRFFQDLAEAASLPGLPDLLCRDDVVEKYRELTGHQVRDLDWYLVYAALRHGVVMSQIWRRMIHFGEVEAPDDPNHYVLHWQALEKLTAGTYSFPASSEGTDPA